MIKRFISQILVFTLVISLALPAVAAEPEIYLYETFDDYAINEVSVPALNATSGIDSRVVERNGLDKAFFSKAWGTNAYMYSEISGVSNTFVVSADIKFEGDIEGASLFSLTGQSGTTTDLLTIANDGSVTISDGKKVGGTIKGKWTNYTFVFDARTSNPTYDFYINGKQKLNDWKIKTKFEAPKEISFFVAEPSNEGNSVSFCIDNLKVYRGESVLPSGAFPVKSKSAEVKTFVETTEIKTSDEATVYNIVDFDTNNNYTQVPKDNILERRILDDSEHPTVFYELRENTSDAFIDIANDAALINEWQFIVQFDIMLIRNGYRISIAYRDTDGADHTGAFITGSNLVCGGTTGTSLTYGTWNTVSVLYDMTKGTYCMYLNGKEAMSPQKLPKGRFSPKQVRIGTSSGGGVIEYYLDDIRIYGGNKVIDFKTEEGEGDAAPSGGSTSLGVDSVFEKDSTSLSYIGNALVFKDDTNAVVFGHKKYKYTDVSEGFPYKSENGTFMIPADLYEKAFETSAPKAAAGQESITASGKNIKLDSPIEEKGGILYFPLRSMAQDVLGRNYMLDRGMHIISKGEFKYQNSISTFETKEPIDSIYRLMQFEHKTAADIYEKMDAYLGGNVHPRIMTDSKSLAEIKINSRQNKTVAEALKNTLAEADKYMAMAPQIYDIPDGTRLLVATRNIMERLLALSASYLMTGDTKYADRAWEEMENCFAWKDWNTAKHYLDNSELLYGVSVAFDSFYDYYTDEQKQIIMDKTWEHSLSHTFERYQGINFSGSEWRTARSNWGFVCNGAVITAILAFGREGNEKYQPYYDYLLECALQAIEYPIMLYYPDGAWEEGMAYWEYALRYFTSATLIPLYYSTGSTLDFLLPEGVSDIADMGLYMQSGNFGFNFSDNADEGKKSSEAVYALALLMNNDSMMQTWDFEMESMNATRAARTLMWYRPGENKKSDLSLDSFFRGVEVGSMKEEWYNTDGSCVFFKGGQNNTNGSHLDTGTFCFDTMGERWSVDLGKDSYNIAGGYNGLAGWELYAKRPEGHNCVVINPRADVTNEYYGGQYLNGRAEIKKMESKAKAGYTIVDLSDTYKYDAKSYLRGFYLGDDRRTLTVQDEISLSEQNSSVYWFMHTRAKIELDADGKGATLSQSGKKLRVDMLTNAQNVKFVINDVGEKVQRFPTDPIREGQLQGGTFTSVKALTLEAEGSGEVYITVKLTPVDSDYDTYAPISYTAIKDWTIPDGEIGEKLRADMIYADGKPIEGFARGKTEYELTVPYGAKTPRITATSTSGEVSVMQSETISEPTYVYVANGNRRVTYKIKYDGAINVTTSLIHGLSGRVGIPDGYEVKYGVPEISILEQAGNDETCLVDGNFDTRWAATGDGVWCEIDLGSVMDINGVALGIYSGDERQNIFRILISENGADYTAVYDGMSTGLTDTDYEAYMFNKKARYIRYEGFKNNKNTWNSVLELGAIVKK